MKTSKCLALMMMPSRHEKYCGTACPCHNMESTHPNGFCDDHPCPILSHIYDCQEAEQQAEFAKIFAGKQCDKCPAKATVILKHKFEAVDEVLCVNHAHEVTRLKPTRGQYVMAHVDVLDDDRCRNKEMKEFLDAKGGSSYIQQLIESQSSESALVPNSNFNYTSLDVFGKEMPVHYGPGQNTIFLED